MGSVSDAAVRGAMEWRDEAFSDFMSGYRELGTELQSYPGDELQATRLLQLFTLEKACYELAYEAANRQDWIAIPVRGVAAILDKSVTRPR